MKLVLCFLLGYLSSVFAHGDHDHDHDHSEGDGSTHVLHLNEDNFDSTVAAHTLLLIEFFAPWCGHCKKLAPEYERAASTLYNEIPLASVDCTLEKDLCSKYGVQGFPTLKTFRNDGSAPGDYQGGRTADEIVKYLRKQNQPAFKTITDKTEFDVAKSASDVVVVGYFADDTSSEFTAFKNTANTLRNDVDFVHANSALASQEGASVPSLQIFRKFDEPKVTYSGAYTAEAVTKWVKGESFPAFGEIGPENYQKYVERDLPLVWAFLDYTAGVSDNIISAIQPVAAKFRGLSFVKLDGVKWASHAKNYGVGPKLPGVVIEDRKHRKNYLFPEDVTADALQSWVQSFVDGKLTANLKSQEVPATQDEAVYVVVGKTFDQIVNDETKDVLVEFYAPWCGHCKNLAPKYEELAKQFQPHSSIVIAKVDSTENDTPAEIKGFPTILFYPSNNKAAPLTYKGERSTQAMSDWIWENAPTLKKVPKTGAASGHEDL
jgi:protein disulfide-isomerase A1